MRLSLSLRRRVCGRFGGRGRRRVGDGGEVGEVRVQPRLVGGRGVKPARAIGLRDGADEAVVVLEELGGKRVDGGEKKVEVEGERAREKTTKKQNVRRRRWEKRKEKSKRLLHSQLGSCQSSAGPWPGRGPCPAAVAAAAAFAAAAAEEGGGERKLMASSPFRAAAALPFFPSPCCFSPLLLLR